MSTTVGKEFYERRPLRLAFDIARSWAAILAIIAACLVSRHPALWVLAILIVGSQQYALQILHHDGMHRILTRDRRRNDLITRVVMSYPLFEALTPFRRKHLDHHRHLGDPADPDRYYHVSADKATRPRFVLFLAGLSSFLATLRGATKEGASAGGSARRNKKDESAREIHIDWILILLVQAAIAAPLTFFGGWYAYPLLWVAPFGFGVFWLQSLRSFAEHAQPEFDDQGDMHRLVTYTSNRLERMFLAPNNMNYHAEHHLYPQVPYYHLPALREHLRQTGELDPVEVRGSYLAFLWRFWSALPLGAEREPVSATPDGARS